MGRKVKITVKESTCRSGFHKKGQEFIIDEDRTICPEMCMELWHYAYPYVWCLLNGGMEDNKDNGKTPSACVACPDGERVKLHIEAIEE